MSDGLWTRPDSRSHCRTLFVVTLVLVPILSQGEIIHVPERSSTCTDTRMCAHVHTVIDELISDEAGLDFPSQLQGDCAVKGSNNDSMNRFLFLQSDHLRQSTCTVMKTLQMRSINNLSYKICLDWDNMSVEFSSSIEALNLTLATCGASHGAAANRNLSERLRSSSGRTQSDFWKVLFLIRGASVWHEGCSKGDKDLMMVMRGHVTPLRGNRRMLADPHGGTLGND